MIAALLSLLGIGGVAGAAFYFVGPTALLGLGGKLLALVPAFLRWCLANPAWVLCTILGMLLLFAKMDARSAHKLADQNAAGWKVEVGKNKTNLASIATLEGLLAAKNAESVARGAALDASRTQNARDVAAADQRMKATTSQIGRLRGIADHATANPMCKAPDALLTNAEGL